MGPVIPSVPHVMKEADTNLNPNPSVQPDAPVPCADAPVPCEVKALNDSSNSNSCPDVPSAIKQNCHDADVRWHDPLILEFFSGKGRVTACMKQLGLSAFGVDVKPSTSVTTCLPADLSTSSGQALCREWFVSRRLAGIFATPPANSAVATAFLGELVLEAISRGVICVIGGRMDADYWQTPSWANISSHFTFVSCHDCAYEGAHERTTVFAASDRTFDRLARFCPGPSCKSSKCCADVSSDAAAYPTRLAMQVACCFAESFKHKGWTAPPSCFDAFDPRLEVPMSRAVAGTQPPASKMPPIVPEHKRVLVFRHPPGLELPCQPMQRLKTDWSVPASCSLGPRLTPDDVRLSIQRTFAPCCKPNLLLTRTPLSKSDSLKGPAIQPASSSFCVLAETSCMMAGSWGFKDL